MKNILNIIVLLIPFYLFSQHTKVDSLRIDNIYSLCKIYTDTIKEPVDLEWLNENIDIVKNNLNIISKNVNTIKDFKEIMPNYKFKNEYCQIETYDLDENIRSILIEIMKGSGSYYIDLITENNLILKMRITLDFNDKFIKDYLIPEIDFNLECLNGKVIFEKIFTQNLKQIKNKKLFIESEDSNYRRKEALNYFVDVYSFGEFREPYYLEYNLGQRTFDHIRYFIINKDYEAMEMLLYCISPTSRLLFVRVLNYMIDNYNYKPNKHTLERMNVIRLVNQLIKSGDLNCWINKFDYDYYDLDKNFELYLKTE